MALASFVLGCCAGSALGFLIARRCALSARAPFDVASAENERMAHIERSVAVVPRVAEPRAEALQLAGFVHELRTPLAAIRAYAELLMHAPADRAFLEEASAILVEEAERLDGLIGAHLDLVRSSHLTGKPEPRRHRTTCELGAEARAMRELMRPLATRCGIAIALDAGSAPVEARGDRALVRQILANLLGNALKHATGGTLVRLRWRREAEEAWLEVEDDGPGIAPSEAARLFEPFAIGAGVASKPAGHGLGLWIAREFARTCGGELDVAPRRPGERGALFRLRLPLATSLGQSVTLVGA